MIESMAFHAAETMCALWELDHSQKALNLDGMMLRLKDLSDFSLTHAEIMYLAEGPEMLALGMFFGMTGGARTEGNKARIRELSEETLAYQGRSENVERAIAARKSRASVRYPMEVPS